MKIAAILPLSLRLLFVSLIATTSASAEPLPVRKTGHWQLTTVAQSIGMKKFDTCLTASDNVVTGLDDKNCGPADIKRIGDEVFVNVVCKIDGGSQKISTLLTGDFQTWYRAVSKITFDPPQDGVPNMGATVDGKFIGSTCDQSASDKTGKQAHSPK